MPKKLYHTTSLQGLISILKDHAITPMEYFVSFSEIPLVGDISANEVTLVFDGAPLETLLDKVHYTEEWYDAHPEQSAYIAGEGWREQYTEPEKCYDYDEDSGWEEPNEECLEEAYKEAELQSFLYKDKEREWISKDEGASVHFSPKDLQEILLYDPRHEDAVLAVLEETHFDVPVGLRQAGTRTAGSVDAEAAGVMFTDGERILLLKRSVEVDHPHTWVIPGGACKDGESAQAAAYREVLEEIGQLPPHVVLDWYVVEQPFEESAPPKFTTYLAQVDPSFIEGFLGELDHEGVSWGWFDKVQVEQLDLHPGVAIVLERANPFFGSMKNHTAATQEELEKLPIDLLDRLAFGISEGTHRLPLAAINIKYEDDYKNAVQEIEEGWWVPEEGADEEPVDVALERGVYWLEDGHHRYVNAELSGQEDILANLVIKDNPVRVLMQKRTSNKGAVDRAVTAAGKSTLDVKGNQYRGLPPPIDPSLDPYVDALIDKMAKDPRYKKRFDWVLGKAADLIKKLMSMGGALPDATNKLVRERDATLTKLSALKSGIDADPQGSVQKMVELFDQFYGKSVPIMDSVNKPAAGFLGMDHGIFQGLLQGAAEQILWGWHNWFADAAKKMQGGDSEEAPAESARSLVKDLTSDRSLSDLELLEQERGEKVLQERLEQPSQPVVEPRIPTPEEVGTQFQKELRGPEEDEPIPLTKIKEVPEPGAPATWPTRTTEPAPGELLEPAEGAGFKFNPQVFKKLLQQRTM